MALDFINEAPVLDADYPLFSWDDWPQSRDALVPLTPVEQFEAACWNDMVSRLEDVLIALESDPWTDAPYFYSGEENYFTAAMYNRVSETIQGITPFYRTYQIGKCYVNPGDFLKTTHLTYIVRLLNYFLEVARGSKVLAKMKTDHISKLYYDVDIPILPSLPLATTTDGTRSCRTTFNIWLDQLPSVPGFVNYSLKSNLSVTARAPGAVVPLPEHLTKTNRSVVASRRVAAPFPQAKAVGNSISLAQILVTTKTEMAVQTMHHTLREAAAQLAEALYVSASYAGRGFVSAQVQVPESLLLKAGKNVRSSASALMEDLPSVPADCLPVIGKSLSAVSASYLQAVAAGEIRRPSRSKHYADILSRTAAVAEPIGIRGISATAAEAQTPTAALVAAQMATQTNRYVNAITRIPRPTWADGFSKSLSSPDALIRNAENGAAVQGSASQTACAMETVIAADVQAGTLGISQTSCEAAVWLLPLQPDTKTLFIRQTYKEAIKIGNTLYVDEWPDQGLTDDGTLFLWKLFDTVLQVGNTLYIGSMPNTGKTDGKTLLIWDVEQEPVQTLTLLEVF